MLERMLKTMDKDFAEKFFWEMDMIKRSEILLRNNPEKYAVEKYTKRIEAYNEERLKLYGATLDNLSI